jgi:hypothetical protein
VVPVALTLVGTAIALEVTLALSDRNNGESGRTGVG